MAFKWLKKKDKSAAAEEDFQKPDAIVPDETESQEPEAMAVEKAAADTTSTDAVEEGVASGGTSLADQTATDEPPILDDADAARVKKRGGLFRRLKTGLSKTRDILTTDIDQLFAGRGRIDEDMLEELEELLITSDIGVQTSMEMMKTITKKAAGIDGPEALRATLKQELLSLLEGIQTGSLPERGRPHVVMVVGVNGVGKTTTIGKLAARATEDGQRVLIAAADTFRAAAIEQLTIWAERAGAEIVKHKANADPAAVAFDSMEAALARNVDTVFVDTAGRLHTKVNLMEELKKIKRTIAKKMPDAPHEVLLVLDATTGQNALSQAKLFHDAIGVSGLALTKLDGTAKGGIVISISQSLNIPLQFIGVGEGIDDLQPFDPEQFANALF